MQLRPELQLEAQSYRPAGQRRDIRLAPPPGDYTVNGISRVDAVAVVQAEAFNRITVGVLNLHPGQAQRRGINVQVQCFASGGVVNSPPV